MGDNSYVPQMGGVLLAHWEHEFLDDTVKIINECPFGVCEVQFRSIIWAPKLGQKLRMLIALPVTRYSTAKNW